ncbi:MAG: hypothetical protein MUE33_07935 [Cytophagaceae bacterium]|jgi:hypothetical protein|nr:hypothetical protein [Cytophagaceae bacterium]
MQFIFIFIFLTFGLLEETWGQSTDGFPVLPMQPQTEKDSTPVDGFDWALQLEYKIRIGYQPTDVEKKRYNDLIHTLVTYDSLSSNLSFKNMYCEDINWAFEIEQRRLLGYQINVTEALLYQSIRQSKEYSLAKKNKSNCTVDLSWVLELEKKIKEGYKASDKEMQLYHYLNENNPSSPNNTVQKVDSIDLNWAIQLEQSVANGYTPSNDEVARYTDIYKRFTESYSQEQSLQFEEYCTLHLNWSLDLLSRLTNGYRATNVEIKLYEKYKHNSNCSK